MSLCFQAAALVASPSYPNSVAWSNENLLAVASGHLVTILNPARLIGSRGLITVPCCSPFPIGVVERKDLLSGCLLSTCISRDIRPCVRSISWSPIGFSPNSGCLLAVCTTEGRVKLYRMPYCEFSAEWVEVLDLSDMLYSHLAKVNFEESSIISTEALYDQQRQVSPDGGFAEDLPASVIARKNKRSRQDVLTVDDINKGNLQESNLLTLTLCNSKVKPRKNASKICSLPKITAEQYASRSAMLSSLSLSWSPIIQLASDFEEASHSNLSVGCSVLAIGGKSGRISFWKFFKPECYSITDSGASVKATLIGLQQAHNTWVTAISWASFGFDASNPLVLLASGSSDGSVRIWQAYSRELLESSEVDHVPFRLMKEVMGSDCMSISVISLVVPSQSPSKMHIAIGRVSGSFQVWICDLSASKFEKIGSYNVHDHIVTGLAWAFDGCCLYSCSQDNSMRSWILSGNTISEVPLPANTPGVNFSTDIPDAYDSCYGLAVSPGNLVIAVAHGYDSSLLNPMYQARTQRAAVEFLWAGSQELEISSNLTPDFNIGAYSGLPEKELICWQNNIIWSFNRLKKSDGPLVLWDIVSGLLAFKLSVPEFVDNILLKCLTSFTGVESDVSNEILSGISKFISRATSRQLHLLNLISRHIVLRELGSDKISKKEQELDDMAWDEKEKLWLELLLNTEKEIRERFMCVCFSAVLGRDIDSSKDCTSGYWAPVGLAQMEKWVAFGHDVKDHLKLLAKEVGEIDKRKLQSWFEYLEQEECSFCSAPVPFESPEIAFCRGTDLDNGSRQGHKLLRCASSMRVCPTTPLWFCMSCERWSSNLAPHSFFTLPCYPSDIKSFAEEPTRPFCIFCGVLLQRLQPEFLLSPSFV